MWFMTDFAWFRTATLENRAQAPLERCEFDIVFVCWDALSAGTQLLNAAFPSVPNALSLLAPMLPSTGCTHEPCSMLGCGHFVSRINR